MLAPIEEGQLYKLTELGTLAEKKMSIPTAINQKGQIAGVSSAGPSTEAAFCYHPGPGTIESVASKPATWLTRAFGLNDVGQVVGDSTFGEGDGKTAPVRQAALFVNGSSASLVGVMDPNVETRAMDINNSGVAVGFSAPTRAVQPTARLPGQLPRVGSISELSAVPRRGPWRSITLASSLAIPSWTGMPAHRGEATRLHYPAFS